MRHRPGSLPGVDQLLGARSAQATSLASIRGKERDWDWSVGGIRATGHRVTPISSHRTLAEFSVPWSFSPYFFVLALGLRRLKALAKAAVERRGETPGR